MSNGIYGSMVLIALEKAIEADLGVENALKTVAYCDAKAARAADEVERTVWEDVRDKYAGFHDLWIGKGKSARARIVRNLVLGGVDDDEARNLADGREYDRIRAIAEAWAE